MTSPQDICRQLDGIAARDPRAPVIAACRRAAQALHLRPDCTVVGFRGNVQTRLAKLAAGEADATLLAMAGLNRLGRTIGAPLDPEQWLPAVGQGAIAIEARRNDDVPQYCDACFTGDYPTNLTDLAEREADADQLPLPVVTPA